MPAAVKGNAILDTLQYLTGVVGSAELDRLVGMLDPASQKLLRNPILASDWYPLDAYVGLLDTIVRVVNAGDETRFIRGSEEVFAKQLNGIYRMFIRLGSPEWIIKRTAAAHQTYFRDVAVELVAYESGKALLRYTGFAKHHGVIGFAIIGFYNKALELSGAKRVDAAFTVPIEKGAKYAELSLTWA